MHNVAAYLLHHKEIDIPLRLEIDVKKGWKIDGRKIEGSIQLEGCDTDVKRGGDGATTTGREATDPHL